MNAKRDFNHWKISLWENVSKWFYDIKNIALHERTIVHVFQFRLWLVYYLEYFLFEQVSPV